MIGTPVNLGGQSFHARVTHLALRCFKRNLAIVAFSAIFALENLLHGNSTGARFHFKAQRFVACAATVFHAVHPVWKNHRIHASRLGSIVQNHITIFAVGRGCHYGNAQEHESHDEYISSDKVFIYRISHGPLIAIHCWLTKYDFL